MWEAFDTDARRFFVNCVAAPWLFLYGLPDIVGLTVTWEPENEREHNNSCTAQSQIYYSPTLHRTFFSEPLSRNSLNEPLLNKPVSSNTDERGLMGSGGSNLHSLSSTSGRVGTSMGAKTFIFILLFKLAMNFVICNFYYLIWLIIWLRIIIIIIWAVYAPRGPLVLRTINFIHSFSSNLTT